jgi:hypothetical protein
MTDQILFDRLAYIDRLKRAGIDDTQARAHAEAMGEALRETVATKADIDRLGSDIARLENKVEADIARLENKIESDITRLDNKMTSNIARLENKMESETTRLETRIEISVRDLTIRMGAIAVALFAALASIKFFG